MMTGRTHTAEKNSSHKQQSADLLKTLLPVMNIDVVRVDVYDDRASKGKVLQNISNEKVFQQPIIYFSKHLKNEYTQNLGWLYYFYGFDSLPQLQSSIPIKTILYNMSKDEFGSHAHLISKDSHLCISGLLQQICSHFAILDRLS